MPKGTIREQLKDLYLVACQRSNGGKLLRKSSQYQPGCWIAPNGQHPHSDLRVIAAGKAAVAQARAIVDLAGDDISEALVVTNQAPNAVLPPPFEVIIAAHPIPDTGSLAAGQRALEIASQCGPETLLVVAVSGGTSSLLAAPAGNLTLEEKARTHSLLLDCGADIIDINTVRIHLSNIKGGGLVRHCPGTVLSFVLSDVAGNSPSLVGSGPSIPGPHTAEDALAVLERHQLLERVPRGVRQHLEALVAHPHTHHEPNRLSPPVLIGSPETLKQASEDLVHELQWTVHPTHAPTCGTSAQRVVDEALETLATIRAMRKTGSPPTACVWVREPSIVVSEPGYGGRSSHVALMLAKSLSGATDVTYLAAGTDGCDGVTNAAGAIVDGQTWNAAMRGGLEPDRSILKCDSGTVMRQLGVEIPQTATHTNLTDLHILVIHD